MRPLELLARRRYEDEERFAAEKRVLRMARQGQEVPCEMLEVPPQRTERCGGNQFRTYRLLARSSRHLSIFCLPMMDPTGWVYGAWLALTQLTDFTYTAFIVALSMAFQPEGRPSKLSWLGFFDIYGSFIYIVDLIVGFQVGILARWDSRIVIVRDGRAAARFYLHHGFMLDLIAVVPSIVQLIIILGNVNQHQLRLLYIMRLLRLARVWRLLASIQPGRTGGPFKGVFSLMTTRSLMLFTTLFTMAVLLNLMGCLWWNVAAGQGLDTSWASPEHLSGKDYNLLTASDFDRWLISVYYATTTTLTIGYGDITPVTTSETAVTIVFQIIGVGFFGFLLNSINNILTATGPRARQIALVKEKLQDVEEVMQRDGGVQNRLLRSNIRNYFAEHWHPESDLDSRFLLFRELPPLLRLQLLRERQKPVLAQLGFMPPGLPASKRHAVERAVAAASLPVWLNAGCELSEAVSEVSAKAGQQAPSGAGRVFPVSGINEGPHFFVLEEGEMRALHPGDDVSVERQRMLPDSPADFCGPAVVGLAALFSPEATCGSSSPGASLDGDKAAADGNGSDSDGGGKPAATTAAPLALPPRWEQRALALTGAHLWRVDSRQLYADLVGRAPEVLLHLVQRLLANLGVNPEQAPAAAAALGGGGALAAVEHRVEALLPHGQPAAVPAPGAAEVQQAQELAAVRQAVVDQLLALQAKLQLAVEDEQAAAAAAAAAGKPAKPAGQSDLWYRMSTRVSKRALPHLSSSIAIAHRDSSDLQGVAVAASEEAMGGSHDVWHVPSMVAH